MIHVVSILANQQLDFIFFHLSATQSTSNAHDDIHWKKKKCVAYSNNETEAQKHDISPSGYSDVMRGHGHYDQGASIRRTMDPYAENHAQCMQMTSASPFVYQQPDQPNPDAHSQYMQKAMSNATSFAYHQPITYEIPNCTQTSTSVAGEPFSNTNPKYHSVYMHKDSNDGGYCVLQTL